MKQTIRISALLLADILVKFALFVMQNYLTDVWGISLTHAAGILNIWNGLSKILPVFFLFLVDALLGHFKMLVISSVAYTVGISFVVMSTPPVLGKCKQYEKGCIGIMNPARLKMGDDAVDIQTEKQYDSSELRRKSGREVRVPKLHKDYVLRK